MRRPGNKPWEKPNSRRLVQNTALTEDQFEVCILHTPLISKNNLCKALRNSTVILEARVIKNTTKTVFDFKADCNLESDMLPFLQHLLPVKHRIFDISI